MLTDINILMLSLSKYEVRQGRDEAGEREI